VLVLIELFSEIVKLLCLGSEGKDSRIVKTSRTDELWCFRVFLHGFWRSRRSSVWNWWPACVHQDWYFTTF